MQPGGQCPLPLRFARCNPTPRRLRAARVWTFVRIEIISIQPDPAEHKLDSAGSLHVPEYCAAFIADCGDIDYWSAATAGSARFLSASARCNPTPRRLRAARVWTIVHIEIIAVQPDPAEHKLDSAGSFRVPGRRRGVYRRLPRRCSLQCLPTGAPAQRFKLLLDTRRRFGYHIGVKTLFPYNKKER